MAKNPTQKIVTKKHLARVERERRQRRLILTISGAVFAIIFLVLAYGVLDQYVLKLNRAVAVVNDEPITLREFQTHVRFQRWQLIQEYQSTLSLMQFFGSDPTFSQQIQSQLQQMASDLDPQNAPQLGANVLEAVINDEVIRQEAVRRGITVSEEEVDRQLQELFGFFIDGTPTPAPTATPFATSTLNPTQLALVSPTPQITPQPETEEENAAEGETGQVEATPVEETPVVAETPEAQEPGASATPAPTFTPRPTATPFTIEGFQARLDETLASLSEAGITENDLRASIRMQILRERVFDEVTAGVELSEEQVWARHILVQNAALAVDVLARLEAGENWTTLAAEVSTDVSNAQIGGDLGWFGRGMMVEEFEIAAFALDIGEISEPVQTSFGHHIIQVLGKEIRPISSDQLQNKRQQLFQEWLDQVKSEQNIEQFDNWTRDVPTTPELPQQLSF
ncbi:MAG: peptidylprolyl isomerase [Anaerolineaceae bacterium]|jgi:parvulin-like peptidyl-prolyl isomerase